MRWGACYGLATLLTPRQTFIRHQILLDDTAEEDVLVHFIPAITFIQAELDKGRGVLVHCQAGMSAFYLSRRVVGFLTTRRSERHHRCGVSHVHAEH